MYDSYMKQSSNGCSCSNDPLFNQKSSINRVMSVPERVVHIDEEQSRHDKYSQIHAVKNTKTSEVQTDLKDLSSKTVSPNNPKSEFLHHDDAH